MMSIDLHSLKRGLCRWAGGVLFAFWTLAASSAFAQSQGAGRVLGRLLDDSGKPVPGATLLLSGPGYTGSATTNSQGMYVFMDVPAGSAYKIRARKKGLSEATASVRINANYTSRQTLKLTNPNKAAEERRLEREAEREAERLARQQQQTPVTLVSNDLVSEDVPTAAVQTDALMDDLARAERALDSLASAGALPGVSESELPDESSLVSEFVEIPSTPIEVVGGQIALAKALKYPEIARRARAEGVATIRVRVDKDGTPFNAEILKSAGNVMLDEAALETVLGAEYKPAEQRGQPVASSLVVRLAFRLR